ncbi:MAG: cobalt-precorrin-5B (C(1))-methyltransferase CbiD [Desulfosalsimonadaceae bacterium]
MGRFGITTGTCATAAAKAAALRMTGKSCGGAVGIILPDGCLMTVPILWTGIKGSRATACVIKDAGDDPDVTHGAEIRVSLEPMDGGDMLFAAGEGVGVVTKPGLQIPVGEPAINPVPRQMIRQAVREITGIPLKVTVSVKNGRLLAERTFNPRLGVVGGISIIGTSGIVRPNCRMAVVKTIALSMRVAAAAGIDCPVLVPGNIGARAAMAWRGAEITQIIEVLNEWGAGIDSAVTEKCRGVDLVGHPGKLAKLITGGFYTHSSAGGNAVDAVCGVANDLGIRVGASINTTEAIFTEIGDMEAGRLGAAVAGRIADAVRRRCGERLAVRVGLIRMDGTAIAESGWVGKDNY